jgi:hypothetical protein
MTDIVRYRLPFGCAGRIAHSLKVRRDLEEIFDYRHRRVRDFFGEETGMEAR